MIRSSLMRLRLLHSWLMLRPFSWQTAVVFFVGYTITFVPTFLVVYHLTVRFVDSADGVCTKTYPRYADTKPVKAQYTCGWFGVEK